SLVSDQPYTAVSSTQIARAWLVGASTCRISHKTRTPVTAQCRTDVRCITGRYSDTIRQTGRPCGLQTAGPTGRLAGDYPTSPMSRHRPERYGATHGRHSPR